MLEFAREQWLWLFVLVAAFYVAWWFARRYRKRRVTYGRIWERVARRVLPPGWKRVLRTVLTLLIGGVLLTAIVLRAAGLQRPQGEQPPPLLVVIVLDNSPSMRALHDGKTRAQLAQQRAQEIVDALGDNDRAIIAHNKEGTFLLGRWLKRGEVLGEAPPTDFADPDISRLSVQIESLDPPPGLPAEPVPQKRIFWLGDAAPALSGAIVETFGAAAPNDAVTSATYTPPEPGEGHGGVIEAATLGGHPPLIRAAGVELASPRTELAAQREPLTVTISVPPDALPQDDRVAVSLNLRGLSRVTLCFPAGADAERDATKAMLEGMLPGRMLDVWAGGDVETDLLVADRVLPPAFSARYLLCFGVLPAEYGDVGESIEARSGLRLATEPPRELGFELPDLSLVWSLEAVPLKPGHKLEPLVRDISGGTLVAIKRGEPEVLYCGFSPTHSTLLEDRNGLLLLLRWLTVIQSREREVFPSFVRASAETEFKLDAPAELTVKLASTPWQPAHGPREYTLTTGADGRGKLGPFTIPGEYTVTRDGLEIGRFTAIWNDAEEQSLRFDTAQPVDLDAFFHPTHEPDWRDHLPGLLLWIALGLLVLEWLLWLAGVTE